MYFCLYVLTKDRYPHCTELLTVIQNDNELLFALSSNLFVVFVCLFVVVYFYVCCFLLFICLLVVYLLLFICLFVV